MLRKFAIVIFAVTVLLIAPRVAAEENNTVTQDAMELKKKPVRDFMQLKKDANTETKAQMQERVADFKSKIKEISDTRKQTIVTNIAEKITSANERLTTKMSEAVTKMRAILEKVKSHAETLATSGADTINLLTAINSAETALTNAQTAIDAQKEKQYSADITDETSLGESISTMVKSFRTDIVSMFTTVKDAKSAVQNAVLEARKLSNDNKEASNSAVTN